jgi:hypothetical protein
VPLAVLALPWVRTLANLAIVMTGAGCAAETDEEAVAVQRGDLVAIPASRFCATAGAVDRVDAHTLHVDDGGMRGVVAGSSSSTIAEVAFTYDGPSHTEAALASGELRRQIGLKLRAKDTCNVLYVTWHVDGGVFVSVKHNQGASTHEECGAGGYVNLQPRAAPATKTAAAGPLRPGERHALRARLDGDTLRVTADGTLAWEGTVPPETFDFDGPPGVRSDNGAFDFELRVPSETLHSGACP